MCIHTTHILGVVSYGVKGKLAFTLHHRSYIAFTPLLAVGSVSGVCPSPCLALHIVSVCLANEVLLLARHFAGVAPQQFVCTYIPGN